jgi:hypothetical protein
MCWAPQCLDRALVPLMASLTTLIGGFGLTICEVDSFKMLQTCAKGWRSPPFPLHFVCVFFHRALINFDQLLQHLIWHCRHYQVVMAEMLNPLYLTFPVLERLPFPRNLRFRKAVDHMYKVLEGATLQCRIHQHSWLLYRVSTRT